MRCQLRWVWSVVILSAAIAPLHGHAESVALSPWTIELKSEPTAACAASALYMPLPGDFFTSAFQYTFLFDKRGTVTLTDHWEQLPPPWLVPDYAEQMERTRAHPIRSRIGMWFDNDETMTVERLTTGAPPSTQYVLGESARVLNALGRSHYLNVGETTSSGAPQNGPRSITAAIRIERGAELSTAMRNCLAALANHRPFKTRLVQSGAASTQAAAHVPLLTQIGRVRSELVALQAAYAPAAQVTAKSIELGRLAATSLDLRTAREALSVAIPIAGTPTRGLTGNESALGELLQVLLQMEKLDDARRIADLLPDARAQAGYASVELRRGAHDAGERHFLKLIARTLGREPANFIALSFLPSSMHYTLPPERLASIRESLLDWSMARLGQEDMVFAAISDSYHGPFLNDVPAFAVADQVFRWVDPAMLRTDATNNIAHARDLGRAAFIRGESLRRAGLLRSVDSDLRYARYELDLAGDSGWAGLARVAHAALMEDLGLHESARTEIMDAVAFVNIEVGRSSLAWIEATALQGEFASADSQPKEAIKYLQSALAQAEQSLSTTHSVTVRLRAQLAELLLAKGELAAAETVLARGFNLAQLPDIADTTASILRKTVDAVAQQERRNSRAAQSVKKTPTPENLELEAKLRDQFAESARLSGVVVTAEYMRETENLRQQARTVAPPPVAPTTESPLENALQGYENALGITKSKDEAALARLELSKLTRLLRVCARKEQSASRRNALELLTEYVQVTNILAQRRRFSTLDTTGTASGYRGHLRNYAGEAAGHGPVMSAEVKEAFETLNQYFSTMAALALPALLPSDLRTSLRGGQEIAGLEALLNQLHATPEDTKDYAGTFELALFETQAASRGEVLAELAARTMLDPAPSDHALAKDPTASRRAVLGEAWLRRERALLRDTIARSADSTDSASTRSEIRRRYLSVTFGTRGIQQVYDTALGTGDMRAIAAGSDAGIRNRLTTTTAKYVATISSLQERLRPREAAIIWFPVGSSLHIFLIRHDRIRWVKTNVKTNEIGIEVSVLRKNIAQALGVLAAKTAPGESDFPIASAYRLYEFLFKPIESDLSDITDIYTAQLGETGGVPLAMLVTAPPSSAAPVWLGDRFALTRMPALINPAVFERRASGSRTTAQTFLGIGDPLLTAVQNSSTSVRGSLLLSQLKQLPNAGRELRSVAQVLGEKNFAHAVITADLATRRTVMNRLRDSKQRVLMFATHGLVGSEYLGPGEPALVLTPDPTDATDDGLLRASDIVNLHIQADLVILSACSTAPAGEDGSEPLAGLASAFLIAGARSVLASHWTLQSDEAEDLTTGMVRAEREQHLGPAAALQESSRQLRHAVGTSHPVFWAPFEVIGFPSSRH